MIPIYWDAAKNELSMHDATLAEIIARHPGISLQRRADPFSTLARSIVGQQISVRAADAVWGKLIGQLREITPEHILASDTLKSCGLASRKVEYLQDLARHFSSGKFDGWDALEDGELVKMLTEIRGIGRWTAEMFLIFQALRPDVLPLDDLGLQRAIGLHYKGGAPVGKREMLEISEPWRPWRSVATWYLWRSLDPIPVEY